MAKNWRPIPDNKVRHVWKCDCKKAKEITVDPSFYADAGTPVCEECGGGLSYVRTETKDPIHEKEGTEGHKHEWTPIAPETGDEPRETWKWCIRCGRLKLGKMVFTPGPRQKKTVKEDKENR